MNDEIINIIDDENDDEFNDVAMSAMQSLGLPEEECEMLLEYYNLKY